MVENILIVLAVVEGRKFQKHVNQHILIEAKFDGEVLTTDFMKYESNLQINTELAWESDKKSLHQHRLQRTPIKVQVFAIDKASSSKELIGYVVLDLRGAEQDGKKKASWHSLLNTKYQGLKPELKMVLSIETDSLKEGVNKSKTDSPPSIKDLTIDDEDNLDVFLDNERGFYLIGGESKGCEIFVFSISVGAAKNLLHLLTSSSHVNAENGFYFYYSIFDNDVTNETFYDLINPNIPTERATVRIYTTLKQLINFIQRKKTLMVYLCSESNTIGETVVSLLPLIQDEELKKPASIEGLFTISNSQLSQNPMPLDAPTVGIAIVLKREISSDFSPVVSTIQQEWNKANNQSHNTTPIKPPQLQTENAGRIERNQNPVQLENQPMKEQMKTPPKKKEESKPTDTRENNNQSHHFLYSIDLRSISNLAMEYPLNCICRYTYPFFGSSSPVLTNPPVFVQRYSEVLLPQSFCKFEFASSIQMVQSTFSRVPLIIEIWDKSPNRKDQLVGIAQIFLSSVFFTEKKNSASPLIKGQRIPFVSSEKPSQKLGEIHVVLGFEDKGIIKKNMAPIVTQSESSVDITQSDMASSKPEVPDSHQPRETQEYQVAMALELWRQKQEEHFQKQLELKENERMVSLAEEWKQRDMEREVLLKKKLEEYNQLESQLRKSINNIEIREKELMLKEEDLSKKRRIFEEEFERRTTEMREASRRVKDEYEHQLYLEKLKSKDLEERHQKTLAFVQELENKLKERENEIYALKESSLSRPEVKLQSQMNLLLLEKNELERKLETVTKSKVHYKQQWGRALRELAKIKLNEQEAAKTRLKKQQNEIDHMKLRYLAIEEQKVIKSERDELQDVKEEINKKLEEIISLKDKTTNENKDVSQETIPQKNTSAQTQNKNQIAKLIEERDTLLKTGVYTLNDRVIQEIDKEIQNLIASDGTEFD